MIRRFESLHLTLLSSDCLMRILCSIIGIASRVVFRFRRIVRNRARQDPSFQFVRYDELLVFETASADNGLKAFGLIIMYELDSDTWRAFWEAEQYHLAQIDVSADGNAIVYLGRGGESVVIGTP